jgi:hypothetical protein
MAQKQLDNAGYRCLYLFKLAVKKKMKTMFYIQDKNSTSLWSMKSWVC